MIVSFDYKKCLCIRWPRFNDLAYLYIKDSFLSEDKLAFVFMNIFLSCFMSTALGEKEFFPLIPGGINDCLPVYFLPLLVLGVP